MISSGLFDTMAHIHVGRVPRLQDLPGLGDHVLGGLGRLFKDRTDIDASFNLVSEKSVAQ